MSLALYIYIYIILGMSDYAKTMYIYQKKKGGDLLQHKRNLG